jgi:predicted CXXCH cytochrome family protein
MQRTMQVRTKSILLLSAVYFSLGGVANAEAPGASETRGYVGSQKCKECHEDKYADWKGTMHSRMVQEFTPGSTDANFATAPFSKDDVKYVIGGLDEYDFVGKKDLKLINAFWDMGKREWVKQDIYNWIDDCTRCHMTGWDPQTKTWSEIAIGCEACHGPGKAHVASAGAIKLAKSVGSDEMCGKCHRGTEEEPRQGVRLETNHGKALADLKASPDARKECLQCHSQDYREAPAESKPTLETARFAVTCVTCHDPHKRTGNSGQLKAESSKLCMECHTAGRITVSAEPKVGQPQKEMFEGNIGIDLAKGLVNSAGVSLQPVQNSPTKMKAACADCHMKYDIPRSAGTMPNHLFSAGTPAGSYKNHFGETVQYNSCTGCHASMSKERFDGYQKEIKDKVAAVQTKLNRARSFKAGAKEADWALYENASTIVAFVKADRSWGIHNYTYAINLLQAADAYITDFLKNVPIYAK